MVLEVSPNCEDTPLPGGRGDSRTGMEGRYFWNNHPDQCRFTNLPPRRVSDNPPDGLKSGFKEEDSVILCLEWDEFLEGERGFSGIYRALQRG